jgi:hypothetical protein
MTTPPATRIEAEAHDFACRLLRNLWSSVSSWSSESTLTPAAGVGQWRHTLRGSVWFSLANRLQVLAIARGGDGDAIEVVNEFINELESARVPLPTELVAFSMDVRAGLIMPAAEFFAVPPAPLYFTLLHPIGARLPIASLCVGLRFKKARIIANRALRFPDPRHSAFDNLNGC